MLTLCLLFSIDPQALNCIWLNVRSDHGNFELQVTESDLPDSERRTQLWYQFLMVRADTIGLCFSNSYIVFIFAIFEK